MHEIVVSNFNFKSIEKEKAFKNSVSEFFASYKLQ